MDGTAARAIPEGTILLYGIGVAAGQNFVVKDSTSWARSSAAVLMSWARVVPATLAALTITSFCD